MLSLPFGAPADRPLRILALGAHADDAEIGCGGTVLRALAELPAVAVLWAVASVEGSREDEAKASAASLLDGAASTELAFGGFRDGYLPYDGGAVKGWVHGLADFEPDLVLTHHRGDLHQDHRFLAELALNAFRDHLILGFEVPKYDGDLGAPNTFVHVDRATAQRKFDHLRDHFGSQREKGWFDDETFRGLMRLRGVESRAPEGYAEAFYCAKLVVGPAVNGPPADPAAAGAWMHGLCAELHPICRSITGDGVRETLAVVARHLPLEVHEVPSGTPVLDWTVPPEWNVRDAYVADGSGRRVVDFARSNLHLVSYSVPVRRRMSLEELRPHLHAMPDRPDWVPYRTSYYAESWGFCISQRDLDALPEGEYEVGVDTTLAPGSLSYGECVLPGAVADEVLLTTHVCHPSLVNDNLSGISLLTAVGAALAARSNHYTYRLLFIPGTIGSITWLAHNEAAVGRIRHGMVVTGVGDPGGFTWKRSRRGDADIDRVATHVLTASGKEHRVVDFSPYGYDERQFCSPGFDLPVGRLGRTPHGEYPEYHTSADDLAFVDPGRLGEARELVLSILDVVDANRRYRNLSPRGEPQLGRRGLYRAVGGNVDSRSVEMGLLWVLNLSDGRHDLLAVAERSGLPFETVRQAAQALVDHDLLAPVD